MSEQKGNRKRRKTDQPKRKRYNATRRGFCRRLRDLERHIAKNPNDKVAPLALPKVQKLATGLR